MKIIVTDITRFSDPEIVCLAGINPETGQCIRPLRDSKPGYFRFDSIKKRKVLPGTLLELDLIPAKIIQLPHIEDYLFSGTATVEPQVSSDEFRSILENSAATTLREGFGKSPEDRCFPEGSDLRGSIITLKVAPKQFSIARDGFKANKFKAFFTDAEGFALRFVPVSDLGFSDHIAAISAKDPEFVTLNSFINSQKELYLRVGLSRAYTSPNGKRGCWIQLNGIYTFPNYRDDIRCYDY
jgi:hypothetical protein